MTEIQHQHEFIKETLILDISQISGASKTIVHAHLLLYFYIYKVISAILDTMAADQLESKQGDTKKFTVEILTEQDIVTVAQRVTNEKSVSVLKHNFDRYSQEVLGMLGSHRVLTITIQRTNSSSTEELELFVKSVPYEIPQQAEFITSQGIFVKESLLFEKVIPLLMENYKSDKWAAACYLAKKDVIVMENLRSQGYKMLDTLYDDLPAIKSVIATLARFHSCSILAEARLEQMDKNCNTLDKYCSDSLNEIMFSHTGGASVWVQGSIKVASAMAESYGHDPQKIRTACNKVYELILPSKKHRNVISHGDLWVNNIMIDNRSEPYKCVLVDFQLIRYAPLVLDILQLLHINTSRNFRREFEKSLMEYYHSILVETIKSTESTEKTKILTIEEILLALDDLRLFGAIISCFYRLCGAKIAGECSKSPERYAKFLSGDIVDIILFFMEKDQLYKYQVEDSISELAEISKKI